MDDPNPIDGRIVCAWLVGFVVVLWALSVVSQPLLVAVCWIGIVAFAVGLVWNMRHEAQRRRR